MTYITPFKRLKWGFLPVRRVVDDDETEIEKAATNFEDTDGSILSNNDSNVNLEKTNGKIDNTPSSDTLVEFPIEYRDEKDRKWWKYFDEYEYRVNKNKRAAHKWFKWFNEDDTPEERRLVIKLDLLLTLYSLVAYWVKYLDQTNLNNAYISGLEEGIGMKGNDLVNTQVMFSIGNIVLQIPFMYVLYAAPTTYVLPTLDICWSIVTICLYRADTVPKLKALRFLVGCFEAPSYIAYQWLFGSWYKVDEISRRSMVYYIGQYLGVLTSGLLSGNIVDSLDGVNGLAAWQWIFIVDGIISVFVGFLGFYLLPGTPSNCYSIFLTDDEIRLARKRVRSNQTSSATNHNPVLDFFKLETWKPILSTWHIYVVALWNIFCWNNSNGTSGAYLLWLKSLLDDNGNQRYTGGRLQDYTALTPALGILWLILTCCYADLFHSRWQAIVFSQIFNITGNVILAVWHVPERAKWFAFCMQYFGWAMAPVLYSWCNDICRRNFQKRTVVMVAMNMLAQSTTAWISVLVWKTVEQPRYLKGFSFTASSAFALCLWTFVVLYLYKKDERKHAAQNGIILYNSSTDPDFQPPTKEQSDDLVSEGSHKSDTNLDTIPLTSSN
ncbi:uncharacterized protein PRCAT00006329001 [Priceomyces carsonii]|uniref:uncharacterized protein n=1 Tax=Priceomyces carsonii TaxID=28549 RepID=UPI002EDB61FC|nr:unnamed protein product [Priceomyces carsonii]